MTADDCSSGVRSLEINGDDDMVLLLLLWCVFVLSVVVRRQRLCYSLGSFFSCDFSGVTVLAVAFTSRYEVLPSSTQERVVVVLCRCCEDARGSFSRMTHQSIYGMKIKASAVFPANVGLFGLGKR
jgi:hypothetical protein